MNHDTTAHRRRSIRLLDFDYTRSGAYYVTICTYGRECIFFDAGFSAIAEAVWREVAASFGALDEFVIMPNHVHGVIWIAEKGTSVGAQQHRQAIASEPWSSSKRGSQRYSGAVVAAPLRPAPAEPLANSAHRYAFAKRPVEAGSLSAIVRTFKSATTKRINRIRGTPGVPVWQRNYYEHIVRDDEDLNRTREYIRDNPAKWAEDPLNPALTGERA